MTLVFNPQSLDAIFTVERHLHSHWSARLDKMQIHNHAASRWWPLQASRSTRVCLPILSACFVFIHTHLILSPPVIRGFFERVVNDLLCNVRSPQV